MGNTFHLGKGFLPSEDAQDALHPMAAALPPKELPYRSRVWQLDEIRNQGTTSQCVGYACKGWLRAEPLCTLDGPTEQEIYQAAQKIDEWPGEAYDGTSVRAGMKFLEQRGHIERYLWAFDANSVRDWILQYGPVVAGSMWYTSFYDPPNAILHIGTNSRVDGGHAWLIVGYDHITGLFEAVNSWGREWGNEGRFWLQGELLDRLIKERGQFCGAIERLVTNYG